MRLHLSGFALWSCLILHTSAKVCNFIIPRNTTSIEFVPPQITTLGSQNEANVLLQNCTTVIGDLTLSESYEGTFEVSGVVNMTGDFRVSEGNVTRITWNDLEYIRMMSVSDLPAMASLSLPKLSSAYYIYATSDLLLEIDVPALINVDRLYLGWGASLKAPLLLNASAISVENKKEWYLNGASPKKYNFSLPSLQSVDAIYVAGQFEDISLPNLKVISPQYQWGNRSNYILSSSIMTDPELNISLPSLVRVGDMSMNCGNSISLPLLEKVGYFSLEVMRRSNITFPALHTAKTITIKGEVTDSSFPALKNAYSLMIQGGTNETNCTTSTADWARVSSSANPDPYMSCSKNYACRVFSCMDRYYPPVDLEPAKKRLSTGDIVGICAGSVGMLLFVGVVINWLWHKRLKVKVLERRWARELEMDGVTIMGDAEVDPGVEGGGVVDVVDADGRRDSKDTVVAGVEDGHEGVGDLPRA